MCFHWTKCSYYNQDTKDWPICEAKSWCVWVQRHPSYVEGKVKVSCPCAFLTVYHATKAYWGNGGIAPHVLDSTIQRWGVSFMHCWLLYPQGKRPWYPQDRRLSGPQSQSGCSGEKNSQPLPGLEPLIIWPIAQHCTAELSQLPSAMLGELLMRSKPDTNSLYLYS